MNRSSHALTGAAFLSILVLSTAEKPATAARVPSCVSNDDCGELQFCDTDANANVCGARGVCTSRGINLMCMNIDVQACGCDGQPYANSCIAHKAGVSIDPQPFHDTRVDGDTLAEQPWMDAAQTHFYLFTGNDTARNDWGTFEERTEPPCTRATPRCMIAIQSKTGTFYTFGSTIELDYDDGSFAFFDATTDCHKAWKLVGDECGQGVTLTPSTIVP